MDLPIFVDDMQAFPDEFKIGFNLRNNVIILVDIVPFDFATNFFSHLAFDARLANGASRVVVHLYFWLIWHCRIGSEFMAKISIIGFIV